MFFDSEASNFRPPGRSRDANDNSDVFQWYELSGNTDLVSRDYRNVFISAASQNPSTGLHGIFLVSGAAFLLASLVVGLAVREPRPPE